MSRSVLLARSGIAAVAILPLALGLSIALASSEPVFAAWGGVVGVSLALVVGVGLRRGWSGWVLAGRLALLAAVATLALGRLLARHGEAVDEGLWKLLGDAYSPLWISPLAVQNTAIALGVSGALAILVSHGAQRMALWRHGKLQR